MGGQSLLSQQITLLGCSTSTFGTCCAAREQYAKWTDQPYMPMWAKAWYTSQPKIDPIPTEAHLKINAIRNPLRDGTWSSICETNREWRVLPTRPMASKLVIPKTT
jgi:hypothetical protein